jgi:hypothetical protein
MVSFRITVSQEGSARPVEVITALFGAEIAAETELARLALHATAGGDPLRVVDLRRVSSSPPSPLSSPPSSLSAVLAARP